MSTPAHHPYPISNSPSSHGGGPRTEIGKATSSQNALTHGLFAAGDFIRPGEEPIHAELTESLNAELAPNGILELNLVDEIRRAMWRLRRCGQVESNLVIGLDDGKGFIFDPMETNNADIEKVQKSIDRARSQSHRLLHKCTAELRKLQTERQLRHEFSDAGTDASHLGLADIRAVRKGPDRQIAAEYRQEKLSERTELNSVFAVPNPCVTQEREPGVRFVKYQAEPVLIRESGQGTRTQESVL